jgi:hypothetical protein
VYVKSEIDASNWDANYSKYYVRTPFNGVHPSSQEYLLWKNKNLTLYVPEVTYKIPMDTEYQLRTGDSVVFFWKDADESDAPYLYEKYVGGEDSYSNPIIKPNFTISAKKPGEQLINPDTLNSSGIIPYDGSENSSFSKVYSMYGEQDLGASRQIEIRKINQVRMTIDGNCKNRFYYFVTNDKYKPSTGKYANNTCYRIVLDKVSSANGKNRFKHILQADEYFFYINEDKTLFGVLGEGTLIDYTISGGDYPFKSGFVTRTLCPGDKNIRSDENTYENRNKKRNRRACRADCRKSLLTAHSSYDKSVGGAVKLLENAREHYR